MMLRLSSSVRPVPVLRIHTLAVHCGHVAIARLHNRLYNFAGLHFVHVCASILYCKFQQRSRVHDH